MSYIIGQYNHNAASADDASFITPITSGTVKRRQNPEDTGVTGGGSLIPFSDECISDLNLQSSNYYYFRGQVKRTTDAQAFNIKLVNYDTSAIVQVEQFIKQITIRGGDREEWVSVELMFKPIVKFDTILFQLQRTINDYRVFERTPKIAYQQLGIINNILTDRVKPNVELLKMGVQSHPGLMMCINGEEIHISRSGIYEVKTGVIPVKFFSVTNPAQEKVTSTSDTSTVEGWKVSVNRQIEEIESSGMTTSAKEAAYKAINSKCFFGTAKNYSIDAFTLDYMYEDN